jgi:hypothetical protein
VIFIFKEIIFILLEHFFLNFLSYFVFPSIWSFYLLEEGAGPNSQTPASPTHVLAPPGLLRSFPPINYGVLRLVRGHDFARKGNLCSPQAWVAGFLLSPFLRWLEPGSFFWLQSKGGINLVGVYLEGTTLTSWERNSDARKQNPGLSLRCELGFEHVGFQRFGATDAPQSAVERGASPPCRAWLPVACCRRCKFLPFHLIDGA